jgi:hypothetical protein
MCEVRAATDQYAVAGRAKILRQHLIFIAWL